MIKFLKSLLNKSFNSSFAFLACYPNYCLPVFSGLVCWEVIETMTTFGTPVG